MAALYELHFWRALLFDEHAMIGVRTCATTVRAWLFFIAAVLLQVLPVSKEDLATFHIDAPTIAILYFGLIVVGAGLSWLLGARMPFYKFLYTSSTIMTFGGVVMAIITYLSILVFELGLNTAAVTNLVTSIIPFYYIVLFAYSMEVASHLEKQWKRIAVALVSICAMYLAYFFI
ncbi:MAG: hypothetical protein AABY13_04870 [Nanoarchaeota archaeon]